MPELPEVQTVRLSLAPHVLNRTVRELTIRRKSVIRQGEPIKALKPGTRILAIERHGKELMILGRQHDVQNRKPRGKSTQEADIAVFVHLGMTGSLCYYPAKGTYTDGVPWEDKHAHVVWRLDDGGWMVFRDPRRFGGLRVFADPHTARQTRWAKLGPDALSITPGRLSVALRGRNTPLKVALMDQRILAGLGNIYADELLFVCGLNPRTPAGAVTPNQVAALVRRMRSLLAKAIAARGSTLRDHKDADGKPGGYQLRHMVYGRGRQPCRRCGTPLESQQIGGRTTVHCPHCQPLLLLL